MERTISLFRKLTQEELSGVQEFVLPALEPNTSDSAIEEHENFEELVSEEQSPVKYANEEVQKLLEETRQECERLKEEARQQGFEEGYASGYDTGLKESKEEFEVRYKEEITEMRTQVKEAILSIDKEKEEMLELYLDDLKNVSVSVAEKVIQVSLKTSDEIIKRMVIAATEKLKKRAWAKIYIGNSKESINIQGDAAFMKELSRLSDNVKVIVMAEEDAGTCIVELPDEIMDISVTTQLENIKDILNNAKLLRRTEEYRE